MQLVWAYLLYTIGCDALHGISASRGAKPHIEMVVATNNQVLSAAGQAQSYVANSMACPCAGVQQNIDACSAMTQDRALQRPSCAHTRCHGKSLSEQHVLACSHSIETGKNIVVHVFAVCCVCMCRSASSHVDRDMLKHLAWHAEVCSASHT